MKEASVTLKEAGVRREHGFYSKLMEEFIDSDKTEQGYEFDNRGDAHKACIALYQAAVRYNVNNYIKAKIRGVNVYLVKLPREEQESEES